MDPSDEGTVAVAKAGRQGRATTDGPPSRLERRDRIARTALEQLSESDYDAIQMRDVAKGADVALATLYRILMMHEQTTGTGGHRRVAGRPS